MSMVPVKIITTSLLLLGLTVNTANANLIMQFEYDGSFSMSGVPGGRVTGDMTLAIKTGFVDILGGSLFGPFDGLAAMKGDDPFFGSNWTTSGSMFGYQNLFGNYAPSYCKGHDMCADATLDFFWNNSVVPIETSFGMDLNSAVAAPTSIYGLANFADSIINAWNNNLLVYFDISSLDPDGDGIPGSPIKEGTFSNVTPAFEGIATIASICLSGALDLPNQCTYRPGNVGAVPIPAAAWLFGSGLVGLIGISRKRKNLNIVNQA